MADKNEAYEKQPAGKFYVDKTCIACNACANTAPDHFKMNEIDAHAFLDKQPKTAEEEELCKQALEDCPVNAIGDDGK